METNKNKRVALIKNGKVETVIIVDSIEYARTLGYDDVIESDTADIGAVLIAGAWTVPVINMPSTLEENKKAKLKALNAWHDATTEAMTTKYSKSELDSFLDKRGEAMAYRVDPLAPTPYINAMSAGNASVKTMLITSILAKVDAVAKIEWVVLAKRDAIESCTTQVALDAITI